jgi:hypothetical protein
LRRCALYARCIFNNTFLWFGQYEEREKPRRALDFPMSERGITGAAQVSRLMDGKPGTGAWNSDSRAGE